MIRTETAQLLIELYALAEFQVGLAEKEVEVAVNWTSFRERLRDVLKAERIEVPKGGS